MTDQPRTPEDDDTGRGSSAAGEQHTPPVSSPYGQQPYAQESYPQDPYPQDPSSQQPYAYPPPYGYGAPQLDAEQEKVRSSAILWTVLNGGAIFLCANLLAIPGVILAGVAIAKARTDVEGARSFVKWSWILFTLGFVLAILLVAGLIAFVGLGAFTAIMSDPTVTRM